MTAKIFYGPERSGKSKTVDRICKMLQKNEVLYLDGRYHIKNPISHYVASLTHCVSVVIIDDVQEDFDFSRLVKDFLEKEHLSNISVIITTNYLPKLNKKIEKHFEVINFPEFLDDNVKVKDPKRIANDCLKSENNEPCFTLRGQDVCALPALKSYFTECLKKGASTDHLKSLLYIMSDFEEFIQEGTKLPD